MSHGAINQMPPNFDLTSAKRIAAGKVSTTLADLVTDVDPHDVHSNCNRGRLVYVYTAAA